MTKLKFTWNNDILTLLAKSAALNEKVTLDSGTRSEQHMLGMSDNYVWLQMTKLKFTWNNDILTLLAKSDASNEKVTIDSGTRRQQHMLDRSDDYVWSANDKV